MRAFVKLFLLPVASLAIVQPAQAILVLTSGSTVARNTTAPQPGDAAYQPWQYQGIWGDFTGTPISANAFLTAQHVGAASTFVYQGTNYNPTGYTDIAGTDLRVWTVDGTFSSYAPLYTGSSEVGKEVVMVGRGTAAGSEVTVGGNLRGWTWGSADHAMSWGKNVIGGVDSADHLYASWDYTGADQGTYSSGDSGGGVFINDGGQWKLAGIAWAVDGPWRLAPDGEDFNAAIFNINGLYQMDNGTLYHYTTDAPGSWYASRVSSHASEIQAAGVTSVPEPAMGLALAAISLGLLRRRGR